MKHLIVFPTRSALNTFKEHVGVLWPSPMVPLQVVKIMDQFLLIYHTRRRLSIYEQRQLPAMETTVRQNFNLGLIDTPYIKEKMSNSYLTIVPTRGDKGV